MLKNRKKDDLNAPAYHITISDHFFKMVQLLDEGKKKLAKAELKEIEEIVEKLQKDGRYILLNILVHEHRAKFSYYSHETINCASKTIFHGVKFLDLSWYGNLQILSYWFEVLFRTSYYCFKAKTFRQNSFLLCAAKLFLKRYDKKFKLPEHEVSHYEGAIMMATAVHIVKLLKCLQLYYSSEGETKKLHMPNMDIMKFPNISISEGDMVMDGLVNDFSELQKLFFRAKIMRGVAVAKKYKGFEFSIPEDNGYYLATLDADIKDLGIIYDARK